MNDPLGKGFDSARLCRLPSRSGIALVARRESICQRCSRSARCCPCAWSVLHGPPIASRLNLMPPTQLLSSSIHGFFPWLLFMCKRYAGHRSWCPQRQASIVVQRSPIAGLERPTVLFEHASPDYSAARQQSPFRVRADTSVLDTEIWKVFNSTVSDHGPAR